MYLMFPRNSLIRRISPHLQLPWPMAHGPGGVVHGHGDLLHLGFAERGAGQATQGGRPHCALALKLRTAEAERRADLGI